MNAHDKYSGGTIHIRQISTSGIKEHFDPPPKSKGKNPKVKIVDRCSDDIMT